MNHHSPFVPLLVITLLAVLVPILVSRVRIVRLPVVVGEILAGIIIGRSGFDLVEPTPTLTFLKEFGFVFLMFLSGLEINLEAMVAAGGDSAQSRWRRPVPLALASFALTVALAMLVGWGLTTFGLARNTLLMGLILSTTSLGIVVPVLKERGIGGSAYGQTLLVTALISDFATLLLLSLVIAILSQGLSLDLLLFMVLLVAFVAAARIGPMVRRMPFLTRVIDELSHATAQIQVRGAFAIMVAWVVLAEGLGVEVILGAFLAGALVSLSGSRHESTLPHKLDAIGFGFFIPLFFIMVGAEFDVRALLASPTALLLVPLLIVAAYLVKLLPALLFRTAFTWRETIAAGLLLSSRLSLIIAASAIALDLDLITSATNAAIILVAVVSCTFSPILFGRVLPTVAKEQRMNVIVLGTNHLAELVGERLQKRGEHVTFIGHDQQRLAQLAAAGFPTVAGDPSDESVLSEAGAAQARALIAVTEMAETTTAVCRSAEMTFGIPTIVARVDQPEFVRSLQSMGVHVVQPALSTALALEGALHFPSAFNVLLNHGDEIDVSDVPLHNSAVIGRPLRRVRLPGNALVLGIRRRGDVVVPHGDTVLEAADVLMLIGSGPAVREARYWLESGDGEQAAQAAQPEQASRVSPKPGPG